MVVSGTVKSKSAKFKTNSGMRKARQCSKVISKKEQRTAEITRTEEICDIISSVAFTLGALDSYHWEKAD